MFASTLGRRSRSVFINDDDRSRAGCDSDDDELELERHETDTILIQQLLDRARQTNPALLAQRLPPPSLPPPISPPLSLSLSSSVSVSSDPDDRARTLNRVYQSALSSQIATIQSELSLIAELKHRLLMMVSLSLTQSRQLLARLSLPRQSLFALPPTITHTPAGASGSATISAPRYHRTVGWTRAERTNLELGIIHSYQTHEMRLAVTNTISDGKARGLSQSEISNAVTEVMTALKSQPPSYWLGGAARNANVTIDWSYISSNYVPSRTATDCQCEWFNHSDPRINHAPFTKSENEKLLSLLSGNEGTNWIAIAQQLNSSRTPIQCLKHFQQKLSAKLITAFDWSPSENSALLALVARYGNRDWKLVAKKLNGDCGTLRTAQQCFHRYEKILNPALRHGRFTHRDELRLKLAVMAHSHADSDRSNGSATIDDWASIARYVLHRSDQSCRSHWNNVANPKVARKIDRDWTCDEDRLLEEGVREHIDADNSSGSGGSVPWTAIAGRIGEHRTGKQCQQRYEQLQHRRQHQPATITTTTINDCDSHNHHGQDDASEAKSSYEKYNDRKRQQKLAKTMQRTVRRRANIRLDDAT